MAVVKAKHVEKDRGWKRIDREIAKARKKPHVQVGVYGSKAHADHGGIPNIKVAASHEFGADIAHPGGTAYIVKDGKTVFVSNDAARGKNLPRTRPHNIKIPERSFIRDTVDLKASRITRLAKNLFQQVLLGKLDTKKALEILGLFVQGEIRKRMSAGIPPPLRPATIARKKSSKPLIDKGQLRGSIDYKVNNA